MGKKVYGNLINRFDEGKNFNKDKQIYIGNDITMYWYSDRTCYYVTDVINQKHIKVKRYWICADRDLPGGMGHQNWKYFKSRNEENEYLKQYGLGEDTTYPEEESEDWYFRNNKWKRGHTYTLDKINSMKGDFFNWSIFTEKEYAKIQSGGEVTKYFTLEAPISFGVRDYHYDWEF